MSNTKTLYTMGEISESIKNLKYQAVKEFDEKVIRDFNSHAENNAELLLDFKTWESLIEQIKKLEAKYETTSYRRLNASAGSLRWSAQEMYKDQCSALRNKIIEQFNSILERLKKMRKPETALEFLGACGISLPEKVKPVIQINVDPEFIKSILPKQNLLEAGNTDTDGDDE